MDEENQSIKVNVKLSGKDLSEMNMLYYKVSKKRNKKIRLIISLSIIIIAITLGIIKGVNDFANNTATSEIIEDSENLSFRNLLLVILIIIIVLLRYSIPLINKYTSRKQYESNKLLQQESEYRVSSEGIQIVSESLQLGWRYEDIYRVVETLHYIMLFESTRSVRLIPKRCFYIEQDIITFIHTIKNHLPIDKYEYYKI